MELGIKTFFDLAWDLDAYDYGRVHRHQAEFMAGMFGNRYQDEFQDALDTYYRLAWSRKPEFMGWEREWDAPEYKELADTEYSFEVYNDARQRLADYRRISDWAEKTMAGLPESYRASFFEMLGYPAMASYQMNRKFLMAQLNHERAEQGWMEEANWAARQSREAYDSINRLNDRYNRLLDGKWNHMMMLAPGWVAKYQNMPRLALSDEVGEKKWILCLVRSKGVWKVVPWWIWPDIPGWTVRGLIA